MRFIPVQTVLAMLSGFEALGLDVDALRAAAGVRPEDLESPDVTLPVDRFGRLWEAARRQAPREELPTELGFAVPFGAFGPIDYLASSSATVEAAFHSLRLHFRQVGSMSLEITDHPEAATVQVLNQDRFEGHEVSDEMTLALFVSRFRGKTQRGAFRVVAVRLTRPAPARPTRHEALFGAPVQFGCRLAALDVPRAAWESVLPDADPALQRTLRALAERLDLGAKGSDLELALRARLRVCLPGGDAEAAGVARALGLSERTLHRRLQELGTTWREVLDGFREAEAERLLLQGPGALSEVALRLGFSDQTAWNRAFRRWKGVSPTDWLRSKEHT